MGQKLVVMDGDTMTRRGFDFLYLHAGWYHNQLGTLLLQTGGQVVADDGTTVTVADPESVAALQIWYDMIYKYKIADPNIASREATVPYQDFIDGKVAMSLMNPWGMGFMTEDTAIGDNWAIVPMPQVNPDAAVNPLYAYYWSLSSLTTDEAKKAAASKLIGYLSSGIAVAQECQFHPARRRLGDRAKPPNSSSSRCGKARWRRGSSCRSPRRPKRSTTS